MPPSQLERVLGFLRTQAAEGTHTFTASPLVVAGVVPDENHAIALMLLLSEAGALQATAIVKCDAGHDLAWLTPYSRLQAVPELQCDECLHAEREPIEGNSIALFFSRGPDFGSTLQESPPAEGKASPPPSETEAGPAGAEQTYWTLHVAGRWTDWPTRYSPGSPPAHQPLPLQRQPRRPSVPPTYPGPRQLLH